jgi:hypothetical protein
LAPTIKNNKVIAREMITLSIFTWWQMGDTENKNYIVRTRTRGYCWRCEPEKFHN